MEQDAPADAARRRELCEFLKYARSRVSPAEAGVMPTGRRRVPGLRRDEVAALCGVSVAWYTWFETGRPNVRASPRFIAAVARSLRLDPLETTYLFSLAVPEMPRMAAPVSSHVESTLVNISSAWPQRPGTGTAALCASCDFFPVGVYCTAPDGRILYANNALVALMGYASRASYMDLDVSRDLYDDARERRSWQREIEEAGRLRNVVTKARRADGCRIYVRDTATAVRAKDGSTSCYLGMWEQGRGRSGLMAPV